MRACTRKQLVFDSKREADTWIRDNAGRLSDHNGRQLGVRRSYLCACGAWHVTSRAQRPSSGRA